MNFLKAWLQASRLPSQCYILFPLLLGQGIYASSGGALNRDILILVLFYGLLIQLFIVFANDFADRELDPINTTYNIFSGGSRALTEKKISLKSLRNGIIATMLLNLLVCLALLYSFKRPHAVSLLIISWALLWAYSYSPFRLSYRGGGEFLQIAGVGVLLPLFGYYAQAGSFSNFPYGIFLWVLPLQFGAALSTTIPDEPSDRQGGKRTLTVIFGPTAAKSAIITAYLACAFLFLLYPAVNIPQIARFAVFGIFVFFCAFLAVLIKNSPPGSARCNIFVTIAVSITVVFNALVSLWILR